MLANLIWLYVALWGYLVEAAQTPPLQAEHSVSSLGTFCMTTSG